MMEFVFEPAAWELTLESIPAGGTLSAVRFLTVTEEESEDSVQQILQQLRQRRITLDVSDLPKPVLEGESGKRLALEARIVRQGQLLNGFPEEDPLRMYLEELARQPACGDPMLLAELCAAGDESARNMLVNVSLHRVLDIACEFVDKGVLLLDLIQEGSLGLWECILQWTGNGNFEEHRDWWIRQTMAALVTVQARAGGVGQKMRQALEDYRAVDEQLLTELGRNPTVEEIAQGLHMSVEETMAVAETLDAARTVQKAKADTQERPEDPDDAQAVEDTAYFQSRQRIRELLDGLSQDEVQLLNLRFGLEGGVPLSPEEAGRKLGLSAEEVVAKEAAALAKLRDQQS